jgi:hypothetical protein
VTYRTLTREEVESALANNAWDLGNQVLYDLCSNHPLHKSRQEIIAKVWLIGRSYSAALERRKNKSEDSLGDLFYEDIAAPEIQKQEIDCWIEPLDGNTKPEEIVETHFKLTQIFYDITKLEKRSLASKYLHFHRPDLFFIYDSRAVNATRQITPSGKKQLPDLSPQKQVDDEYLKFYRRCLWLRDDIEKKFSRKLSPRDIDKILLFVSDRKAPKKSSQAQNA